MRMFKMVDMGIPFYEACGVVFCGTVFLFSSLAVFICVKVNKLARRGVSK